MRTQVGVGKTGATDVLEMTVARRVGGTGGPDHRTKQLAEGSLPDSTCHMVITDGQMCAIIHKPDQLPER